MDWRYKLSWIIPMHFTSYYGVAPDGTFMLTSWWQWRGRVWGVRSTLPS